MCYNTSILRGIAVKTGIYFVHTKKKKDNSPGAGCTNTINFLMITQMF